MLENSDLPLYRAEPQFVVLRPLAAGVVAPERVQGRPPEHDGRLREGIANEAHPDQLFRILPVAPEREMPKLAVHYFDIPTRYTYLGASAHEGDLGLEAIRHAYVVAVHPGDQLPTSEGEARVERTRKPERRIVVREPESLFSQAARVGLQDFDSRALRTVVGDRSIPSSDSSAAMTLSMASASQRGSSFLVAITTETRGAVKSRPSCRYSRRRSCTRSCSRMRSRKAWRPRPVARELRAPRAGRLSSRGTFPGRPL